MWYREFGITSNGVLRRDGVMPAKLHLARLSCKIGLETSRVRSEFGEREQSG